MITQAHAQRRGVALVLVLAFLVLISVFIIGFFVSATGELQQSTGYAATISTQQLSETATNIVMGQIREATTRPGEVWASQPGMVRTYRTKVPRSFYKLYSSNKMVVEGKAGASGDVAASTFRPDTDVPVGSESGWNHKPAIYVDLNDPVRVPLPGSDSGVSGTLNKDYEYRYPIFDPASFYQRTSEGDAGNFPLVSTGPGVVASKLVEGAELVKNSADDSSANPIGADKKTNLSRMPVRWLYVLKDGTMTSPVRDLKGTVAQWDDNGTGAGIPTANNPIVGRIAFWTDDETCKVNINTAGGFSNYLTIGSNKNEDMYCGSYWDTPRFSTNFDEGVVDPTNGNVAPENMSLALAQPIRNEFQRYPGHPATTSLGLVFRNMLSSAQIYALTPRLMSGLQKDIANNPYSGSDGGTRRLVQAKGVGHEALPIKRERLYASVDELLFAAPKTGDSLQTQRRLNNNEIGTVSSNGITPEFVNRMRFFLTAHSRAPELTVFGGPRVTIWPMWPMYTQGGGSTYSDFSAVNPSSPKTQQSVFKSRVNNNPTEKLIAYCSTIGPQNNDLAVKPYFFQRSNPYSATDDGNIKRNLELFKYLTGLMGQPVLGAGGSDTETPNTFKDKYPGEIEAGTENAPGAGDYHQIIAEIFDYIRCVNLNDTSHDTPAPGNQTAVPGDAGYVYGTSRPEFKYSPHAYVVPTMTKADGKSVPPLNNSPGFGRFPTISEAALVFYHAGYVCWDPSADDVPRAQTDPGSHFRDTKRRVHTVLNRKEFYDIYAKTGQTPNPLLQSPPTPLATANANQRTFLPQSGLVGGTLKYDADGVLIPGERVIGSLMKAFLLFENFTPMQGYAAESSFNLDTEVKPRGLFFQHEITGLDSFAVESDHMPPLTKTNGNLNFPYPQSTTNKVVVNRYWDSPWGDFGYLGGMEGFFQTLRHCYLNTPPTAIQPPSDPYFYPFQSSGSWKLPTNDGNNSGFMPTFDGGKAYLLANSFGAGSTSTFPGLFVPREDKTFKFKGGNCNVNISFAGTVTTKLELHFPPSTERSAPGGLPGDKGGQWPVPTDNIWDVNNGGYWHEGTMDGNDGSVNPGGATPHPPLTEASQFTLAGRIDWTKRHSYNPWLTNMSYDGPYPPDNRNYGSRRNQFLLPGDTIRSLVPHNPNSRRNDVSGVDAQGRPINMGDPRTLSLIGLASSMKGKYFLPHPLYDTQLRHAQGLRTADAKAYFQGTSRDPDPFNKGVSSGMKVFTTKFGTMFNGLNYQLNNTTVSVDMPDNIKGVFRSDELLPDFDNGLAGGPDGGFCNKSDEGSNAWRNWESIPKKWTYLIPYYATNAEGGYNSYFSPNKQMPSPVQFGSLLAGRTKHWQTLCFCPNAIGNPHPGITRDPKDHYILDMFTMPVVEPFAISEPFSTLGKINLNFAMAPFGHIRRQTAMRAVLHAVRIPAVPNLDSTIYKSSNEQPPSSQGGRNFRFRIDRDETMKAFQSYFSGASTGSQEIFRTGSQICEMYLYPNMYMTEIQTSTGAKTPKPELKDIGIDAPKFTPGDNAMKHFWEKCLLTGDNMREKPYNDIYPRITTKSNTYTVHMWVQALRKSSTSGLTKAGAATAILSWDEAKDQVIAEYRGSTTIERYIDPEDRHFDPKNPETVSKNDLINPDTTSLESLYRFRVVESKRFNP
jgi:hypothetical protein